MKPVNIEERRARHKREAVCGILFFALIQLACIVAFVALCMIPDLPTWLFYLFAALAVLCVVPMIFALKVLKQRFQEIEGGELDEASQY